MASSKSVSRAAEAREFARRIVDSEEYRQLCVVRLFEGTLPPAVEVLLLHYRYGKPADHLVAEVSTPAAFEIESMDRLQLAKRARELAADLEAEEMNSILTTPTIDSPPAGRRVN